MSMARCGGGVWCLFVLLALVEEEEEHLLDHGEQVLLDRLDALVRVRLPATTLAWRAHTHTHTQSQK
jgi:hypothetical protein